MAKEFDLEKLVRKNVTQMKAYASARDEYKTDGREMTFLDANENPFETGLNRYPDPQQSALKAALAVQNGLRESNILLGNGSDEVLDLLFRAFCEPRKDNVISLPPTYGMYGVLANLNAVENREVVLTRDFEPDVETILKSIDEDTKIIFLCSPNNPTGNSFSKQAVRSLLNEFGGLVVIDEAYIDFTEDKGWLQELQEFPNLVITQTLSKAYGLAGIRLGICYASEEIIRLLNKIKPPYNVNQLTQKKALERLSKQQEVALEIQKIRSQRDFLKEELKKISFVERVFPSEANFLLVRVDDANLRYDQLISRGIVVRNRSKQPLCQNTLRFTIGTLSENIRVVKILQDLVQQNTTTEE